jgi:hypothetical protein
LIHAASWNWVIFAIFCWGLARIDLESTVWWKSIWLEKKIAVWRWDSTNLRLFRRWPSCFLSGYIAENYGLPLPFLSRVGISIIGFFTFTFLSKTLFGTRRVHPIKQQTWQYFLFKPLSKQNLKMP